MELAGGETASSGLWLPEYYLCYEEPASADQEQGDPYVDVYKRQNLTHDMIGNTGHFSISVLSQDVPFEIFQHFGFQSGRDADKFGGWAFAERSENGTLHLTKFTNRCV